MHEGNPWFAFIAGVVGGLVGPMIGVGGGVIVVPMLTLVGGEDFRVAVAASLFSVLVASITATVNYMRQRVLVPRLAAMLVPLPVAAAVLTPLAVVRVQSGLVELAFAGYLYLVAYIMGTGRAGGRRCPGDYAYLEPDIGGMARFGVCWGLAPMALMAVSGAASAAFGVGGGVLFMPVMVMLMGIPFRVAAATSMMAVLPTAAMGTAAYAALGLLDIVLALQIAAGSLLGSYVSTRYIARRLRAGALRNVFRIYMALAGTAYIVRNVAI